MPESPKASDPKETYVRIAVLESMSEAQLLGSILSERRVRHFICSYHDTAYDGLFQVQKGWGEIRAPLAFREQILEVLAGIRSTDMEK